ncbi:minichromosome maintenance protein MCM [Halorientalis persicus]|uniref:hypothetical protein n=1 Tax=Halorientalis persicus TaxID=1367881 RepID=UPI0031390B3E
MSSTARILAWDPGTRMEEIAEYAKRVAPHSVSANGAETTAVGLTSSAYKSKSNRKNWEADAGTLVLGDGGLTCITQTEQLSEDAQTALQQVMHEQIVETSKATVNQTLPARTAILGISKAKYGRFDQYEPIAEQFDLTPSLVSRSDLVFAVTDQPDTEQDRDIADHTLSANYAGEVNTQRANADKSGHSQQDVEEEIEAIAPPIGPDLFRKYISYAKRNVFPTMCPDAKDTIRDFYVDVRSRGDDDSPVPVTSRKLEALVRLAEASARMRLDDTVRQADAERVIDVVEFSLKMAGTDPKKEELDEDVVAGQSQSQHDRAKNMKALIQEIELRHDLGAPVEDVLEQAQQAGMARSKAEHEIDKLKHKGEIYEPASDHLQTT